MKGLIVKIPSLNQAEIKYTFDCLLGDFLGLEYSYELHESKDFVIVCGRSCIRIISSFFDRADALTLYNVENLPSSPTNVSIRLGDVSLDVLTFYGSPSFRVGDYEIEFDFDLVAATFFMLTRWEEYISSERDMHDRFVSANAYAVQHGFIKRAIVNEYVELLWAALSQLKVKQSRRKREFRIIPTHDVDRPYAWWGKKDVIRSLAGATLKRRHMGEFKAIIKSLCQGVDLVDTHDLFMLSAEKENVQCHFFFMSGGNSMYDNRYQIDHPRIRSLVQQVVARGHSVGLHPSYNSYLDSNMLHDEKNRLEAVVKKPVLSGRHHYLRFEVPATWRIWDEVGMSWDSTMNFADITGFRCGVCYPFKTFDIEHRVMLNLVERPLIVMEGSYMVYQKATVEHAIEDAMLLKQVVRRYDGEFVFLWHNSSFNTMKFIGYDSLLPILYSS